MGFVTSTSLLLTASIFLETLIKLKESRISENKLKLIDIHFLSSMFDSNKESFLENFSLLLNYKKYINLTWFFAVLFFFLLFHGFSRFMRIESRRKIKYRSRNLFIEKNQCNTEVFPKLWKSSTHGIFSKNPEEIFMV